MENGENIEYKDKIEYELNQFEFIIFIPDPSKGMVTFFIDDGQMESAMYIEMFLDKLKKVCGEEEMNKIDVACHDYGVPYFYDRHKKILKELSPAEEPRTKRIVRDIVNPKRSLIQSVSLDSNFNNVISTIDRFSGFGMPSFTPPKVNPFGF